MTVVFPRRILCIIGPTAVGKTLLSLEIARRLDCEIISVDSRQVYRHLDIGTDKVTEETREKIPHHLIDVAGPERVFSAADFVAMASAAIEEILLRGKIPLLAGGTPFYYQALFEGILTNAMPRDRHLSKSLDGEWNSGNSQEMLAELKMVDPVSAKRIHPHDKRRVLRALEVYRLSGYPISSWYEEGTRRTTVLKPLYLGLYRPKASLRERIARRAETQFESGFPEEVRGLLKMGYDESCPALQGFGYRELVLYHRGEITLDEALEEDIRATRAFAKRQMTWFRKFAPALWYDVTRSETDDVIRQVILLWENHLKTRKAFML
ncbi:MAG: tRNA (adenosine(37)-N6)-dimethylallyltransferase MiaA [Thermovirgaceae bacterium]